MATLYLKRVGFALVPDGDESVSALAALPFGKTLRAEIKQPRNVQHHRLFFAICKRIGDGIGRDAEQIATIFKLATGHCEIVRSKSHGELRIPKSIAFGKMGQDDFRAFYDKCVVVALDEWGIEPEALSDLIDPKTEIRSHSTQQVA